MYCFSAHACRGFHSRSLADHMTTAGNVVRGGRTACRGRCPHRPVLSVDWAGGSKRTGFGMEEPSCRCVSGGWAGRCGHRPLHSRWGACHSSSRGGSVGRDVPSFCFRSGFRHAVVRARTRGGRMLSYGLPPEGCRPYEVYTIDQLRKIEFRLLLTASWKRCRPKDCS